MSALPGFIRRRLLRSALFCPADKEKVLLKTLSLRPDVFIYDLEDAVNSTAKERARGTLKEFLSSGSHSSNLEGCRPAAAVRVNCPMTSIWGENDLKVVANIERIEHIVLPKVENLESIQASITIINSCRHKQYKPISLWAMIETAKGVLHSEEISSSVFVDTLVFGSNDLTKDLHAKHVVDQSPLLFSMSKCILAARANGKNVLDGVYNNFKDSEGFEKSCLFGRSMGFDGRSIIHPSQIDIAHGAYSPSTEEIRKAREIVLAFEEATGRGESLAVVDGRLVEELHVQEARMLLEYADLINKSDMGV